MKNNTRVLWIITLICYLLTMGVSTALDLPYTAPVHIKTVPEDTVVQPAPEPTTTPSPRSRDDHGYNQLLYEEMRYWLAYGINGEAGAYDFDTMVGVGTAILNRAEHPNRKLFGGPDIKGVVTHKLEKSKDHQFSFMDVKHLREQEPNEESYRAADLLLSGYRPFGKEYVYYANLRISKGTKDIIYEFDYGLHSFGKEPDDEK